jgi:hypothetical protein
MSVLTIVGIFAATSLRGENTFMPDHDNIQLPGLNKHKYLDQRDPEKVAKEEASGNVCDCGACFLMRHGLVSSSGVLQQEALADVFRATAEVLVLLTESVTIQIIQEGATTMAFGMMMGAGTRIDSSTIETIEMTAKLSTATSIVGAYHEILAKKAVDDSVDKFLADVFKKGDKEKGSATEP